MANEFNTDTGEIKRIDLLTATLTLTTLGTRPSGTTTTLSTSTSYNLRCNSKSLPISMDAVTWKRILDDPTYVTSETFVGKSEGYEACEFEIPLNLTNLKNFEESKFYGDLFTLTYTYDDTTVDSSNTYTITINNCVILGCSGETYENNSGPYNMTLKVQPRGGLRTNCAIISSSARSSD